MTIANPFYSLFVALLPEVILTLTAMLALFSGFNPRLDKLCPCKNFSNMIAVIGCVFALVAIYFMGNVMRIHPGTVVELNGIQLTNSILGVKGAVVALSIFALMLTREDPLAQSRAEYSCILLFSAVGLMLLAGSSNLLVAFISLELAALAMYLMVSLKKGDPLAAEASLKYFIFGGMSSAFLLFGFSLIYGVTGSIRFGEIGKVLSTQTMDPLLLIAFVMIIAGLGFKLTVAPFHLWAPDTYEGAPLPAAAFIASASKVACFFITAMIFFGALAPTSMEWKIPELVLEEAGNVVNAPLPGWKPLLAIVAVISMVYGNLTALAQRSVRRLLAYSAVAHAGYILIGIVAIEAVGFAPIVYYTLFYALATIGAFGIASIVLKNKGNDYIDSFVGLGQKMPGITLCLIIFFLSLAGIPPLAGFFGKFYLFVGALKVSSTDFPLLYLVIIGFATSVISLYYYLKVLKVAYNRTLEEDIDAAFPYTPFISTRIILAIAALGLFIGGCFPQLFINLFR